MHAEHVGHVDAIDFSEEMIAIAEERKAKAQVDNVDFHVASIVDFAGENDRYDVVMGMSVLHLLEKLTLCILIPSRRFLYYQCQIAISRSDDETKFDNSLDYRPLFQSPSLVLSSTLPRQRWPDIDVGSATLNN